MDVVDKALAGTLKLMVYDFLADALCNAARDSLADNSPYGEYKEDVIEGIGKSPRQLMQTLGTEWGRQLIGEDVWVNIMRNRIQREADELERKKDYNGLVVIIPDVRFDNEVKLCDLLIRVVRDGAQPVSDHASEGGIPDDLIDYTVSNNGSLLELDKKAAALSTIIVEKFGASREDRAA